MKYIDAVRKRYGAGVASLIEASGMLRETRSVGKSELSRETLGVLQQFVGAKVQSIYAVDDESVAMTLILPDGSDRTLAIYHAHHEPIAVRIDGQYAPPEDL